MSPSRTQEGSRISSIEVAIEIDAPPELVWSELADISSHVEWMADAEEIEFIGPSRSGVGTEFLCRTKIGPLHTTDHMTVTQWDLGSRIAVEHIGLFKGAGRFELKPIRGGQATSFVWSEDLTFPWYLAGVVGATLAKPILTAVWRGNLKRLQKRIT